MRVPIGVPGGGGGVWGRVQVGGGGRFSCGKSWKRDRHRNRQVNAQALSKLPFSKLLFSVSPNHATQIVAVKVALTALPQRESGKGV